jgi:hypothetical protein
LLLTSADFGTTRSGGQATLTITSYQDATAGSSFRLFAARGTLAAPATLQSGDTIASLSARAWTSGTTFTQSGFFRFQAAENHSSTATGSSFILQVCANGGTTLATALTLDQDRKMTVPGAFAHTGSTFGVLNTAPATKQTVTGSRGGNAALASLLAGLVAYGLITDSTTA